MLFEPTSRGGRTYLEPVPGSGRIERERDLLDLVGACLERGIDAVLLEADDLGPDFFELRTGLAGAALQKLANYHLRLALVMTASARHQGRFGEMVAESNRGQLLRVFDDREAAAAWLVG